MNSDERNEKSKNQQKRDDKRWEAASQNPYAVDHKSAAKDRWHRKKARKKR